MCASECEDEDEHEDERVDEGRALRLLDEMQRQGPEPGAVTSGLHTYVFFSLCQHPMHLKSNTPCVQKARTYDEENRRTSVYQPAAPAGFLHRCQNIKT